MRAKKKLTRDDVRIEPIHANLYDGKTLIGEVLYFDGDWRWWDAAGNDELRTARTRQAAINAVIRAENARRKGER